MSIDDESLLSHTPNISGYGSVGRYFVPSEAYDQITIAAKAPPKGWRCATGASEKQLQRYGIVMEVSASFSPSSKNLDWGSSETYFAAVCTITFTNLSDSAITVGYNIPSNCNSFLEPRPSFEVGNSTLSTAGVVGSKGVGANSSGTISFGADVRLYGGIRHIGKVNFPGSVFSILGEEWTKDTTATVSWTSSTF